MPSFDSATQEYDSALVLTVDYVYIKPTVADPEYKKLEVKMNDDSWIEIASGHYSPGFVLLLGENEINIRITGSNGVDQKIYIVIVEGLLDSDGDCIADKYESGDFDGDGIANYLDADDDGDGVLTMDEYPDSDFNSLPNDGFDSDQDGYPDYLDIDDDNDGIPSSVERLLDEDSDNDGIPDQYESNIRDFDGDMDADYLDYNDDGDSLITMLEERDANQDGNPDYYDPSI
mgnify:FL=1